MPYILWASFTIINSAFVLFGKVKMFIRAMNNVIERLIGSKEKSISDWPFYLGTCVLFFQIYILWPFISILQQTHIKRGASSNTKLLFACMNEIDFRTTHRLFILTSKDASFYLDIAKVK